MPNYENENCVSGTYVLSIHTYCLTKSYVLLLVIIYLYVIIKHEIFYVLFCSYENLSIFNHRKVVLA